MTRYHSCEQQGHEQCAGHQQENDKNTDQLIQRTLQPHDHLQREEREEEREVNLNTTHLIICVNTETCFPLPNWRNMDALIGPDMMYMLNPFE